MKRILALLVAVCLSLPLSGCGSEESAAPSSDTDTTSSDAGTETTDAAEPAETTE